MKKSVAILIIGFICLMTVGVLFELSLKQPCLITGFMISPDDFSVIQVSPKSPAWYSGLKEGDVIVRLNDIDTADFASRYYMKKRSVYLSEYSKLFTKNEICRCELSDGSVHSFLIPEEISISEGLHFLSTDDKVDFCMGALFIFLGIILILFCSNEFEVTVFSGFLYSIGLSIASSYIYAQTTITYSILKLAISQIATSFIACNSLRMVAFFYNLAGRKILSARINSFSVMPFFLILLRLVCTIINPVSFFDGILFYLPYLNLISLIYCIIMFFVLISRIPGNSSLILRFILVGTCFSLMAIVTTMINQLFGNSIFTVSIGSSLFVYMPLLFIPVSFICAFIQTRSSKLNVLATRIMILGCSVLVIGILILMPFQSYLYRAFLCVLAPFMCLLLEKMVTWFLFPEMNYIVESYTDLEKILFSCEKESEIYALTADWLKTTLSTNFIVFYQIPDDLNDTPGKTLYKTEALNPQQEEACISFLAERCADSEKRERLLIHENWGISAPIYKAHHVFGYVFIGARSQYELFSNHEMQLIQPIARILMESLIVYDLKQQVKYINNMQNHIVYSFADMIESRDGTTGQHVKRTSLVVDLLTGYLKKKKIYADKLKSGDYALISLAAPLHDIGKIKVPDRILSKPGKLTPEEFEIIKTHPVVGEKIINKTMLKIEDDRYLTIAREMALYHHEKWDGTGYPEGLKGKKIPISARIMAVADVFDALCSSRSYKQAFSIDEAFEIVDKSSGTHFEPVLVEAMHALKDQLTEIYASIQ